MNFPLLWSLAYATSTQPDILGNVILFIKAAAALEAPESAILTRKVILFIMKIMVKALNVWPEVMNTQFLLKHLLQQHLHIFQS